MPIQPRTLTLAILTALLAAAPLYAQDRNPADGQLPEGPSSSEPATGDPLPGTTCSGAGGSNCSVAIPDAGPFGTPASPVSSEMTLESTCADIADVNVGLDITHTWVGDLGVVVTSPEGTSTGIVHRPGSPAQGSDGCSGNNIYAILDDSAGTAVEDECALATPTIDGTFRPNQTLLVFTGESGVGTWTLTVQDLFAAIDSGTLNDWSLELECGTDEPRATFAVSKEFTDDNPAEVEVTLSCNTGLPIEQSTLISEGDGVEFVVVEFDDDELDCEITETVPNGYDVSYSNGLETNEVSCAYDDVNWGAHRECQIVNSPAPVDVAITKQWVTDDPDQLNGVDTGYEITLSCNSEILGGNECGQLCYEVHFQGEGDDLFNASVIPRFPTSTCFVEENVFDSAVEIDNACGDSNHLFEVAVGQGYSCTITNTVFFEGIPALNQYGKLALALLMLGIGFVGFRRLT